MGQTPVFFVGFVLLLILFSILVFVCTPLFCILWPEVIVSLDCVCSESYGQKWLCLWVVFVLNLMARDDCVSVLSVCSVSYVQRWLCLCIVCLFCILWPEMIVSLYCLFVLNLMARDDCVSGLCLFCILWQRWLCLCIVCLFCILWPEVIVSLDCLFGFLWRLYTKMITKKASSHTVLLKAI